MMQEARDLGQAAVDALDDMFKRDEETVGMPGPPAPSYLPDSVRCKRERKGVRCRRYHGHEGRCRGRDDDGALLVW
jgi:hypothetical protein